MDKYELKRKYSIARTIIVLQVKINEFGIEKHGDMRHLKINVTERERRCQWNKGLSTQRPVRKTKVSTVNFKLKIFTKLHCTF
jgi:hypothetical protein